MSILRDLLIVAPRGNIGDDVANPEAVQRNFEAIDALFPLHAQNIANDVLLLAVAGTKRRVAFGTALVTWAGGSATSGGASVTHGLGVVPVVVVAVPSGGVGAGGWAPIALVNALTSTTFTLFGQANGMNQPAAATTGTFYWVAIG